MNLNRGISGITGKPGNPFLNSNNNNNSNNNSNNIFYNRPQGADDGVTTPQKDKDGKDKDGKDKDSKDKDREFPPLFVVAESRSKKNPVATTATTATTASYRSSLVSGINQQMLEEQSKMRSEQAADLDRRIELQQEENISSARVARAILANNAAATDLELAYDE
jgi:hypothetical protein